MIRKSTIVAVAASATLGAGVIAVGVANADATRPGDSVAGARVYDEIVATVYGTPEDRMAAERLVARSVYGPIADCMAQAGSPYVTPSPEEQVWQPPAPGSLTAFAPIGADFGAARDRLGVARAHDRLVQAERRMWLTGAQEAKHAVDTRACMGRQPAPALDEQGRQFAAADSGLPLGQDALVEALHEVLFAAADDEGVRERVEGYSRCMAERGFAVASWAKLHDRVLDELPSGNQPVERLQADPQWESGRRFEVDAAAADKACRSQLREYALGVAAEPLARLARERAGELAVVADQWRKIRAATAEVR